MDVWLLILWKFIYWQNSNFGGLIFGKDGDGNYGYYGADDSLIPFKSGRVIAVTVSGKTNFNSAWTVDLGVKINSFMWWSDAKANISYVTMGACHESLKKLHSSSRNETVDFNYGISGTTVTFPQQPLDTFKNGALLYFIVV